EHLKTCASCRERDDRLGRVDQVLERGGLSEQRLDALQARILGKLPVKAPEVVPPPSRGWLVMLAAAAVVVLVASFTVPAWLAADDGFKPRGGGESWGVRAFCVRDGKVTGEARPGGTLACGPGGLVQFTYTAPSESQLSISLEGSGQEFFAPAKVKAGIDVSLPTSTPVGDWLSGPQKVRARFTDAEGKPLAESQLLLSPSPRGGSGSPGR
ncbi:MAG: hypothetical protein HY901_28105, partial [Deltaproteobacteria bacterium]|nr:hypothetical protein [Deltaproteobacteria bacterium]